MTNRPVVLGIARDITDIRRAEEVRDRLLAAIDQVAEGIIIADQDGKIEHVNPAYTELTGFDNEDAMGRYITFPAVKNEAQAQELHQAVRQRMHWTGRLLTHRKDGTRLTQELTLSPVQNEVGASAGFIAIRTRICNGGTSER
jgi:PAS domain S-box-containing protein